jgi:hypothetical protein
MSLHYHKVDDRTLVKDGDKPVHVPSGWEIAPGDAHDIRVCTAHPWQSCYLIFSNGDVYGTPMHPVSSSIGTTRSSSKKTKFSSRLEIGKKVGSGGLIQGKREKRGARGKYDDADVLLRRRS